MPLLIRRQLLPVPSCLSHLLLLLGRQPIELLPTSFLLRRQILEPSGICLGIAGIRWPVRIEVWPLSRLIASVWRTIPPTERAHRLCWPIRRSNVARPVSIRTAIGGPPRILPLLPPLLSRRLPLLLSLLLLLLLGRLVRVVLLRCTRQSHPCVDHQRNQYATDLDSQFHLNLYLLCLLRCFVRMR